MKIYISIDMEGMPGTWNWEQEKTDHNAVRKAIFDHVKDVLEALLESSKNKLIEEIVIADSHGKCNSLSYEITDIDRRIKLISGIPRPNFMIPAFTDRFDMAFLLGYHSGNNVEKANMDHTYSSSRFQRLLINDIPMDEVLINAAYIGCFGTPVTLITGDLYLRDNIIDKLPWAEFVATKEGIAHLAAINYSAIIVREETKKKVHYIMAHSDLYRDKLYHIPSPITLTIEFKAAAMADTASYMPYSKRINGNTVEFTSDDYKAIFQAILTFRALAITASQ